MKRNFHTVNFYYNLYLKKVRVCLRMGKSPITFQPKHTNDLILHFARFQSLLAGKTRLSVLCVKHTNFKIFNVKNPTKFVIRNKFVKESNTLIISLEPKRDFFK